MTGRSDRHDQLLHQIAEERVAALNRIARSLEQRIQSLNDMRACFNETTGDVRAALLHR